MGNFIPLPSGSQASGDVLYLCADAGAPDLYEAASSRLNAAKNMLYALSDLGGEVDSNALAAVACASSVLLSDAEGLFDALFHSVLQQEVAK
jgi:hypothetical protein